MSIAGTIDAPLELFGGLVTDMAAADLPQGVSPDCQDVSFLQGAVKTRPGILSVFSPIAGNPTVDYLKPYTQRNLARTLLALDSAGTLWGENTPACCRKLPRGWREIRRRVRHRSSAANISPCTMASLESTFRANTTARISTA